MTTRQRYVVWAWIGLIVASCIYPPWHQGNSSRGYGLIFAPPYATVDVSRLILEWVAISALLAGLFFVCPAAPLPRRLNFLRIHLSRRAIIGLISTVAVVACVCGAWGLSRISRPLPSEELLRLDGLCSSASGTFSGEIHNGSESWTIREVTIRLTLKEKVILDFEELGKSAKEYGLTLSDSPPGTQPQAVLTPPPQLKSRDYQIPNLSVRPLETCSISVKVLTPPGSEFVQWKPVAAKGFKNFWHGIEKISAVPPAKIMGMVKLSELSETAPAKPQVSSAEPDVYDNLLRQAPPAKKPKFDERAQPVQSLPSLPKGYTFADQPAAGASASKSERALRQVPTLPPSFIPDQPAEMLLSIKDAANAGFVRTSFRNPEGSSSGDSVLLIVVKIGGPDHLVLTIPPGLLLKSPLPASQDMIIAGLKGRDLGGGKYTPASTTL